MHGLHMEMFVVCGHQLHGCLDCAVFFQLFAWYEPAVLHVCVCHHVDHLVKPKTTCPVLERMGSLKAPSAFFVSRSYPFKQISPVD